MKRTFFALLLIISTAMTTACGDKDETPEDTIEQKLIGNWKLIEVGLDADGKEVERYDSCQYWELLSDKTGRELEFFYQNSKPCTPDESFQTAELSFTWKIVDSQFIYDHERLGEVKMEIIHSSDKEFKITRSRNKTTDWDWGENVVSVGYQLTKV